MITALVLEGCPPSMHVTDLLANKSNCKIFTVSAKNKEHVKKELKITTFPQIYFQSSNNKMYQLGGRDELVRLINDDDLTLYSIHESVQKEIKAFIKKND